MTQPSLPAIPVHLRAAIKQFSHARLHAAEDTYAYVAIVRGHRLFLIPDGGMWSMTIETSPNYRVHDKSRTALLTQVADSPQNRVAAERALRTFFTKK